jgi:hypothetical protein
MTFYRFILLAAMVFACTGRFSEKLPPSVFEGDPNVLLAECNDSEYRDADMNTADTAAPETTVTASVSGSDILVLSFLRHLDGE